CNDDRPHDWDVILEQHVCLFRGAMGAEFLLWMTTPVSPCKHCRLMPSIEDITRMDCQHTHRLESNKACVGYAWSGKLQPISPLPTCLPELRAFLMSGVIFPRSD
ncbi:hypothetical protein TNCV_246181, partial [Trichonephila clavipes]